MATPLRILILEDRQEDAELTLRELRRSGFKVDAQCVDNERDFLAALDPQLDIIIADYTLPQFDGRRALKHVRERNLDVPFILVSGTVGEEAAVDAIKEGAADYVMKDRLKRLGPSVAAALREKKLRDEKHQTDLQLNQAAKRLANILNHASEAVIAIDAQQRITVFNKAAEKMFGYRAEELFGQPLDLILPKQLIEPHRREIAQFAASPESSRRMTLRMPLPARRKDGSEFPAEIALSKIDEDGDQVFVAMVVDITERVQAETALLESEEQFRLLFETVPVGLAIADLEGNIITFNDAILKPGGYSRQDIIQMRNIGSIYADQDERKRVRELFQEYGFVYQHQVEFKRKDGSTYLSLLSLSPIRIKGKQHLQVLLEDITERNRVEQTLKASESRYRSLFENMLEGLAHCKMIFENDEPVDFTYLAVNGAFERLTGLKNVVGKKVTEVIPEIRQTNPELFEIYGRVASTGKPERFETFVQPLAIWLSIYVYSAEKGSFVAVFDNITERKRAERHLASALGYAQTMIEQSPIGIVTFKESGEALTANQAYAEMIGGTVEQIQSQNFRRLDPWKKSGMLEAAEGALTTNSERQIDTEVFSTFGKRLWMSCRFVPFTYDDEKRLLGLMTDITQRKSAELEILHQNQELLSLYQVGHDLSQLAEPKQILESIFNGIGRVLDNRNLYVALYDEKKQYLDFPVYTINGERRQTVGRPLGNGLSEYVIRERVPLFIPRGLDEKMRELGIALIGTSAKTFMAVPMQVGEKVVGVIAVQDYERENAYLQSDLELLATFATQAAIALENARLFEETQKRAEQFSSLYETVRELATFTDLPGLLQAIIDRATGMLGSPSGVMYLYDSKREELELVRVKSSQLKLGKRYSIHQPKGMVAQAARTRKPVIVDDYQNWEGQRPRTAELGIRAALQVPMLYHGDLIGIIGVGEFGESTRTFSEDDVRLLTLFAGHAAAAVHNARLLEETKRSADEFAALFNTARDLSAQTETTSLLQTIVERAQALLSTPAGAVYLYDAARDELELVISVGAAMPIGTRLKIGEGAAGRAAQSRQPLIVDDYQTWEHRSPKYKAIPFAAVMHVPMLYGGKLVGVLVVHELGKSERKFTDADAQLLMLLASQAASAVDNARLLEETSRRASEFQALFDTATDVSSQTDLSPILQTISQRAMSLLNAAGGGMYLYDQARGDLVMVAALGIGLKLGTRLQIGEGMAGRVAESREPLIVDDYKTWENRSAQYKGIPFSSVIEVPMLYRGELIGVLVTFEVEGSQRRFTEQDVQLLTLFAAQAASAVNNAQLLEETKSRADEFAALYENTRDLTTQYDLERLLRTITERAARLLHASDGEMQLYDEHHSDLELIVSLNNQVATGARTRLGEGMAGRVAETRSPMVVDDYQTWEGRMPLYADLNVRGVVDVPMLHAGKLVGVVSVYECGDSTRKFTEQDTRLLSLFASQAASAVNNARLLEETKQRAEQLATLNEVGRAISAGMDIGSVIEAIHQQTKRVIPFDTFYVVLHDSTTGRISYPLYYEAGKRYAQSPDVLKRGTILSRTLDTAQPRLINRTREELGSSPLPGSALGDTSRKSASLMFAPMVYGSRVIGVISAQSYSLQAYQDRHLEMLAAIANQAAIAIENARLFEDAQQRAGEFAALYETSRDLSAQTDLNAILSTIVERASKLLDAASGFIYLYNSLRNELELAVTQGFNSPRSPTRKIGEGMAGRVAESKQPIIVKDYQTWEHRAINYVELGFRAILEVPMIFGGTLIGVLGVNEIGESTRQFTEEDERLLSLFAAQAANAVYNARLLVEARQRADEFAALYEVTHDLTVQHDLQPLLKTITERAVRLLHASNGEMHMYHAAREEMELIVNLSTQISTGTRTRRGEGMVGRVAETKEPLTIKDYSTWEGRLQQYDGMKVHAVLQVPMLYGGELIGVLGVSEHDESKREFNEQDTRLLSLFAAQAANAVHNARLFDETVRRAEELSTLNEIAKAVSSQLELDQALDAIYNQVKRILPLDAFFIALYDPEKNELSYPLFYDEGKRYSEPPSTPKEGTRLIQTIRTGESILFNHTAESHAAYPRNAMLGNTSKVSASLLYVPLRLGARVIGAMSAQSYTFNAYSPEHSTLFTGVANQAAIAIENARLFADTQRHLRRVESLHEIDNAISGSLDLRVTFNVFLDQIVAQLHADAADVLLLNPHTQTLEFAAARGFRTPALQHTHLRVGDGLAGRAALERQTITISDLVRDIDGLARSPFIQSEGFVAYFGVPLVAKGRVNGVLEIFQRTPIDPNKDWLDFLETMAGQAAIAIDNAELYGNLQRANIDLALAYDTTLEGWSRALDLRDRETEGHTRRVTDITVRLAREMGIAEAELVHVRRGSLLHDIGKMGIPDAILFKPGPLTDDEWKIMRQHPVFAYELISPIEFLRASLDIPYCHHEKWDGTGYPRGIKGEQIPVAARLFAVVDVWDALRSDRPYRRAWDEARVRDHIRGQAGSHFDPNAVELFLKVIE